MVAVDQVFRDVLDDCIDARECQAKLDMFTGKAPFSNGYFHTTEGTGYRDAPGV